MIADLGGAIFCARRRTRARYRIAAAKGPLLQSADLAPIVRETPVTDARTRSRLLAGLVVACLVWSFATLFLCADLGKWADDYSFTMRDPVSATYQRLTPNNKRFFRPLSRQLIAMHTLLWFHDPAKHAISAISHGVTAALLWFLLRALDCSRGIATAGALLFLVYPAPYEVAFWVSALGFALAASLFLVLSLLVVRLARGEGLSLGSLVVVATLAFAIASLNEQPAAGVVALPLLYLCTPARERSRGQGVRGACEIGAACAIPLVAYIYLYSRTADPAARGMSATLIGIGDVVPRAVRLAAEIRGALLLSAFGLGPLRQGLAEMVGHPVRSVLWLAAFGAAGVWWFLLEREWPADPRPAATQRAATIGKGALLARGLLFGATVFVAAWAPVFIVRDQGVASRLTYFPAIGLAVIGASLAQALSATARRARPSSAARSFSVALVAALVVAGAISMVGIQGLFHRRATLDAELASQLREIAPAPDHLTVFVPVNLTSSATETASPAFDNALPGPLEYPWAATHFVRWTYRRDDLFVAWQSSSQPSNIRGADEHGLYFYRLTYLYPLPVPYATLDGDLHLLPWELVVPLVIDTDGRVHLVTNLVIRRPDGGEQRFAPSQATRIATERGVVGHTATVEIPREG
ncbi:MAG TPA: hypothetical protein VEI94_09215 [Candidatus Bathyarchaeia archaeon]|nr:hypothetical protein [Candidatus Bathyarchaeia archaeon]